MMKIQNINVCIEEIDKSKALKVLKMKQKTFYDNFKLPTNKPFEPKNGKTGYFNYMMKILQRFETGNFKDDKYHGKWILWRIGDYDYEQKKRMDDWKWTERNYLNGKSEGKYIVWHSNGQMEVQGNYKDGKKEGKWAEFDEGGQITVQKNYKDGELVD